MLDIQVIHKLPIQQVFKVDNRYCTYANVDDTDEIHPYIHVLNLTKWSKKNLQISRIANPMTRLLCR